MLHVGDMKIIELRSKLMNAALRKGVHYQDAEDLVSDSIIAGMNEYNATRGDFAGFCFTILKNRMKNHWRSMSRHPHEEYVDERKGGGQESAGDEIERRERMKAAKLALEKILRKLTRAEREFYEAYLIELQDADTTLVAKAARRIGISLQEAHNRFRRIQRKADAFRSALEDTGVLEVAVPKHMRPFRQSVDRHESFLAETEVRSSEDLSEPLPLASRTVVDFESTVSFDRMTFQKSSLEFGSPVLHVAILDAQLRSASSRRFTSSLKEEDRSKLLSLLN
jgi:RNA polymerase sigma factor (sigma-70 family)